MRPYIPESVKMTKAKDRERARSDAFQMKRAAADHGLAVAQEGMGYYLRNELEHTYSCHVVDPGKTRFKCMVCGSVRMVEKFHSFGRLAVEQAWRSAVSNVCTPCTEEAMSEFRSDPRYSPEFEEAFVLKLAEQKRSATERRRPWFLRPVDVASRLIVQDWRCALTGLEFDMDDRATAMSVDRRDNRKGYSRANIQLVQARINKIKQTYTNEELVEMCRAVVKFSDMS